MRVVDKEQRYAVAWVMCGGVALADAVGGFCGYERVFSSWLPAGALFWTSMLRQDVR